MTVKTAQRSNDGRQAPWSGMQTHRPPIAAEAPEDAPEAIDEVTFAPTPPPLRPRIYPGI